MHSQTYRSPWAFRHPHVQTILPAIARNPAFVWLNRSTLATPDGDELQLDWSTDTRPAPQVPLVIISHGLEGHSQRAYVRGMAKQFVQQGWHALGWNFRGCGGQMNKLPRFYHNGSSDDLESVIRHALALGYQHLHLVGFSMGGNITLNYLARHKVPIAIKSAAVFSVPMDIKSSAEQLAIGNNQIYMRRFLTDLGVKLREKEQQFPNLISTHDYHLLRNFHDFDTRYTAPLHGFSSAEHYWQSCSTIGRLKDIHTPCLLINALDDPFLGKASFATAQQANKVICRYPQRGGHVGWPRWRLNAPLWSEQQSLEFAMSVGVEYSP